MKQAIIGTILLHVAGWAAWSQSPEPPPQFEIADVHVSAKSPFPFVRIMPLRAGRYELKTATMVDLIGIAYGFDADKVLGGPNWLEMDRFDVLAKVPAESTPETQKLMLQALLADRFKLVLHQDSKPLPTYALTQGKKLQLKESDGTGETGCKPQSSSSGAQTEGGIRIMSVNGSGTQTNLVLGPGMTIEYLCRNMTMTAFAAGMRTMLGASLGTNPVLDQTGLKGAWNFDLKWSLQMLGPNAANQGDRITLFEALDKQLGLKLEEKQNPTPVLVVDSVNQKPSDNPPGVAEALPAIPAPTEFEVASVKPADPGEKSRFQVQTGGRLTAVAMPMRFLINRAFNSNLNDQIVGLPKWADNDNFDIIAKGPAAGPSAPAMDTDSLAPMLLALLKDRFKLTYHIEDRPLAAYSLVSVKPKMKKADPASRTYCKNAVAPAGSPPGSRSLTCQNITMAEFAEQLQNKAPGLNWPILDATGIAGSWDFTLTFSANATFGAPLRAAEPGQTASAVPAASDPTGGYTLFEALEKQVGLKLESQKRPMPVFVIDHLEQKPTEN